MHIFSKNMHVFEIMQAIFKTNGIHSVQNVKFVPLTLILLFFPDQYIDGGLCKPCHSTCETCDGPTEHACVTCSNPLILQGTRCVAECEKGSYHDKTLRTCVPCLHTCASCMSKTNCTECVGGLQVMFAI